MIDKLFHVGTLGCKEPSANVKVTYIVSRMHFGQCQYMYTYYLYVQLLTPLRAQIWSRFPLSLSWVRVRYSVWHVRVCCNWLILKLSPSITYSELPTCLIICLWRCVAVSVATDSCFCLTTHHVTCKGVGLSGSMGSIPRLFTILHEDVAWRPLHGLQSCSQPFKNACQKALGTRLACGQLLPGQYAYCPTSYIYIALIDGIYMAPFYCWSANVHV